MSSPTHTVGKNFSWTTFLLVLAIAQITTAKATSGPTIAVEPYASTAQAGESFTINISLTDVQNLYGVEVTLHWNASILQIVGVDIRLGVESRSDGVLHEPIFIAKNEAIQEEGKYLLAATSTSPAEAFSGSGNVLRITFNVTNVGGCKLDMETKLSDWPPPDREPRVSWPIAHNTVDGFFGREVKISVFPLTATTNDNVSISGSIIPPRANVEVIILYRSEGETDWHFLTTVETNEQGNYLYLWRLRESGKYEVKATAIIEGIEETSSSVHVTVETPEQTIWKYITILLIVIVMVVVVAVVMYRRKSKS